MEELNTDELIESMKRDEFDGATKLTPREYGRFRGIQPQLIYYHIREGHIQKEQCVCGRSVIDIELADKYFHRDD